MYSMMIDGNRGGPGKGNQSGRGTHMDNKQRPPLLARVRATKATGDECVNNHMTVGDKNDGGWWMTEWAEVNGVGKGQQPTNKNQPLSGFLLLAGNMCLTYSIQI